MVSFFQTTHSIPESLGIVVKTDEGNIVYTGDFKFDQAADKFYRTDFGRLAEIGNEGVLALLSDSANADSNVQVASMHEAGEEILNRLLTVMGVLLWQQLPAILYVFNRFLMRQKQLVVVSC